MSTTEGTPFLLDDYYRTTRAKGMHQPHYGMFSYEGDAAVHKLVTRLKRFIDTTSTREPIEREVDASLETLADTEGCGEACDTAVRELVWEALRADLIMSGQDWSDFYANWPGNPSQARTTLEWMASNVQAAYSTASIWLTPDERAALVAAVEALRAAAQRN